MKALTLTSITDWSADRSKPPAMVDVYMHTPPFGLLLSKPYKLPYPYPTLSKNFVGRSYRFILGARQGLWSAGPLPQLDGPVLVARSIRHPGSVGLLKTLNLERPAGLLVLHSSRCRFCSGTAKANHKVMRVVQRSAALLTKRDQADARLSEGMQ